MQQYVAAVIASPDGQQALEIEQKELDNRQRNAASRNILIGSLLFVGGTFATVLGLALARSLGGGPFLIFWGAILFGLLQLLRGISQLGRGKNHRRGSGRS